MQKLGKVWTFAVGAPATGAEVAKVLYTHVDGATIHNAFGYWKGELERCVVIRIAGITAPQAVWLADYLRRYFNQEAVYVEVDGVGYLETATSAHTSDNARRVYLDGEVIKVEPRPLKGDE